MSLPFGSSPKCRTPSKFHQTQPFGQIDLTCSQLKTIKQPSLSFHNPQQNRADTLLKAAPPAQPEIRPPGHNT
ncbi:hypothetical protein KIN20_000253 [Parelaphostrongylus tenuis]|uniref:Uncharacterized protein n=1 Tax=Parelaphostrongylus tenuis TaxID=148309 RepID=A0AAD5LRW6_PARTN|nr:hypothetical protein KIN20_000253 [Parelaphostrongylus tenuis]